MSIENFQGIYPANKEQLRDILSRQRDREISYAAKSLVVLLALNLAREGGNGLRESSRTLDSSSTASGLTPRDVHSMPEGIRERIGNSLTAIMCGVAIYSIDDTISNKAFSYELVAGLYNMGVSGTPFVSLKVGEIKEEEILDDKYPRMISLATKDRTLTSFFEQENLQLIPNGLTRLIDRMEMLPVIRSEIIPIFKPRAQLLISP